MTDMVADHSHIDHLVASFSKFDNRISIIDSKLLEFRKSKGITLVANKNEKCIVPSLEIAKLT